MARGVAGADFGIAARHHAARWRARCSERDLADRRGRLAAHARDPAGAVQLGPQLFHLRSGPVPDHLYRAFGGQRPGARCRRWARDPGRASRWHPVRDAGTGAVQPARSRAGRAFRGTVVAGPRRAGLPAAAQPVRTRSGSGLDRRSAGPAAYDRAAFGDRGCVGLRAGWHCGRADARRFVAALAGHNGPAHPRLGCEQYRGWRHNGGAVRPAVAGPGAPRGVPERGLR